MTRLGSTQGLRRSRTPAIFGHRTDEGRIGKMRPSSRLPGVRRWKRAGCESHVPTFAPVRLTPQPLTYLAKTPSPLGRPRVRRIASYTKGQ
jgi:hypothetical protein